MLSVAGSVLTGYAAAQQRGAHAAYQQAQLGPSYRRSLAILQQQNFATLQNAATLHPANLGALQNLYQTAPQIAPRRHPLFGGATLARESLRPKWQRRALVFVYLATYPTLARIIPWGRMLRARV